MNKRLCIWLCFAFLFAADVCGQSEYDYDYLKEKYSSEDVVVLTSRREISVVRRKEKIVIIEKVYLEKLMTGKDKEVMNMDVIPFSTFSTISGLEAYTLVEENNEWKKHMVWSTRNMMHVGSFLYNDNYLKVVKFPSVEQGCRTVISYTKTYTEPYLWEPVS